MERYEDCSLSDCSPGSASYVLATAYASPAKALLTGPQTGPTELSVPSLQTGDFSAFIIRGANTL